MDVENLNNSSNPTIPEANTNIDKKSFKLMIKDLFSNEERYLKYKWFSLGAVITLIIAVTGFYLMDVIQKQNIGNGTAMNKTANAQTSSLSTTTPLKPVDPSTWIIELSKNETSSTNILSENNLIYAIKNEYKSIVYKRNLQNGNQTKIFDFNEVVKAEKSGNLWEGLPPNIALSPNKNEVAFIDNGGLKLFNIRSGNIKVFISQTSIPAKESTPPKWSVAEIEAYSLARPLWSSDEKYISFLQSQFEGASFGVVDTGSGSYIPLKSIAGGYDNLVWSPMGHLYALASSGDYTSMGLYVSSANDTTEASNIALNLGKTEDTPFFDVNFSPNGQKIVFTFAEPYETQHLAVANTDGTNFTLLDSAGGYSKPFFSSDGSSIFTIQKRGSKQVLVEINLVTKKAVDHAVLPPEFNDWRNTSWTKDGYLTLVGVSSSSGLTMGGDSTRLMILDLQNKKVIYVSSVFNQFTTFAGFSN